MDKLDDIFRLQATFDESLSARRRLSYTTEEWIQKDSMAIVVELAELLDEVNFKWWKNPRPVDKDRVAEELADVLHFFVSMCLKVGLSADDLHGAYVRKNRENFLRQEGLSAKEGYRAP